MDAQVASRVEQQLQLQSQRTNTAVSAITAGVTGQEEQPASLLALPDACLMVVLRCLAADAGGPASVFSAARAHSRLQQAVVAALTSISVQEIQQQQQQQVNGLLRYLHKHGQHISSVSLRGAGPQANAMMHPADLSTVHLRQLPSHLQLSSLELHFLNLQLQPSGGCQGVLGASAGLAALRQLRLSSCVLLGSEEGLAEVLSLLLGLEHLSICGTFCETFYDECVGCPASSLQQLQQLTYLELDRFTLWSPDPASCALQQALQGLTRLVDLRLNVVGEPRGRITASALSGMCQLTRLDVFASGIEPAALDSKTRLQHLQLRCCSVPAALHGGLFEQLQQLQQLTYLDLYSSFNHVPTAPAAAYSALTASSKLRRLNIGRTTVPPGVWQHVFPAGRRLPHLTALILSSIGNPRTSGHFGCNFAAAPNGSLIVSCCPTLQSLEIHSLCCTEKQLAPLQQLSMLTMLR